MLQEHVCVQQGTDSGAAVLIVLVFMGGQVQVKVVC